MTRALVVNGDDFGLTPGVNAGILAAHLGGILTSASLFANAGATDEAIRIAAATPTLGVGCHLTLADGDPVLPPLSLPTLAPGGRFRPTWTSFIRAAMAGRIALAEIERELTAQIDRVRSAGITPTHLDAHKHVHAYPPVFDVVARLARRFRIRAVRVPCEDSPFTLMARYSAIPRAGRQAMENLALLPWSRADRRTLARYGLPASPRFLGRALTGVFTARRLQSMLRRVAHGVSELMSHPGYPDAALSTVRTRLRLERAREVELLTSPETIDFVVREGLVLMRHDGVLSHHSFVNRYAS